MADLLIILFMVSNYLSSIAIVFFNKAAYRTGFPSMTLTCLHFIVTALGMQVCASLRIFQPKHIRVLDILPLSIAFCCFVVLTNFSLTFNTVGFYQLAKVMTTPCIVIIQMTFYKMTFANQILLSLGGVCVGVILATNADTTFNTLGCVFAVLGVISASLYQIWVKTMQKDLNSFQLLYYQAPLSAVILAVPCLFLEPAFDSDIAPGWISLLSSNSHAMIMVVCSCLAAFAVNLSIFLVIGKTSPITYNVLGHFKLCTVLAGGFIIFQDPLNSKQGFGILITLLSVFVYTHFKIKNATTESKGEILPTKTKT